jgi:hypothetical protein
MLQLQQAHSSPDVHDANTSQRQGDLCVHTATVIVVGIAGCDG